MGFGKNPKYSEEKHLLNFSDKKLGEKSSLRGLHYLRVEVRKFSQHSEPLRIACLTSRFELNISHTPISYSCRPAFKGAARTRGAPNSSLPLATWIQERSPWNPASHTSRKYEYCHSLYIMLPPYSACVISQGREGGRALRLDTEVASSTSRRISLTLLPPFLGWGPV